MVLSGTTTSVPGGAPELLHANFAAHHKTRVIGMHRRKVSGQPLRPSPSRGDPSHHLKEVLGRRGAPERQRKSLVIASAKLGAAMRMAMEQTMWKRAKRTRQSRSMTAPANFHWLQVARETSWLRKR